MRKYRIVYESKNEIYKIEKRYFFSWKPLTREIYKEQVDLVFGNMYDLEIYLKEMSQDHVENKEDFSILFI